MERYRLVVAHPLFTPILQHQLDLAIDTLGRRGWWSQEARPGETPVSLISDGLVWADTPQGLRYWRELRDELRDWPDANGVNHDDPRVARPVVEAVVHDDPEPEPEPDHPPGNLDEIVRNMARAAERRAREPRVRDHPTQAKPKPLKNYIVCKEI